MSLHLTAIQSTAVLSLLLWTKVVFANFGLGGAKNEAGARAPEDFYQKKADEASPEAKSTQDRAQRIVNNDLENIPYTMVLAWASVFCIYFGENPDKRDSNALTQIVLYTAFVTSRIGHTVFYAKGAAIARSVSFILALLCSFGIGINGCIAAFNIT
jgi:uncharacterized MAPEG superfamily protein